ncbi:MAG: restriction endonuclease subunit S [candidate division Zixibacteria bacterium]|nr:restriction endonuclease subunit S [candidate division Zixibacteria bacterium]
MKSLWKDKPLGAVFKLEYGKPLHDTDRKPNGLYPVYGANGEKGRSDKFYVDKPSIIVGRKGSAGEVNLTEERFWPLDVTYFVTFDERQYELRFLYYLLTRLDLPSLAKGVKPGINRNEVYSQVANIPPLPEQQRIVGILDKAFEGIATAKANAEKNLQNARAIFESHLQSVFTQRGPGWVETTLGDIAQIKGGKRVPKGYKLLNEPTDFPYLRVTEFTDSGTIDMSDLRYVSAEVHREIKNYVISSKDLYISIAGTIGKTGIIPEELDGANLTENACRLVFNPGISNRFVYFFTVTPDFVEQAGFNTRTAAQPKLALSRLATIRLSVPHLAEQKRLADKFDTLREETQRLASRYERKLAALEALKKSLLHQAFSGAL